MATQQNSPYQLATLQNNTGLMAWNSDFTPNPNMPTVNGNFNTFYLPNAGLRTGELAANLIHVKFFCFDQPQTPCSDVSYVGLNWSGSYTYTGSSYLIVGLSGATGTVGTSDYSLTIDLSLFFDASTGETLGPIVPSTTTIQIYATMGPGYDNTTFMTKIFDGLLEDALDSYLLFNNDGVGTYLWDFVGNCPCLPLDMNQEFTTATPSYNPDCGSGTDDTDDSPMVTFFRAYIDGFQQQLSRGYYMSGFYDDVSGTDDPFSELIPPDDANGNPQMDAFFGMDMRMIFVLDGNCDLTTDELTTLQAIANQFQKFQIHIYQWTGEGGTDINGEVYTGIAQILQSYGIDAQYMGNIDEDTDLNTIFIVRQTFFTSSTTVPGSSFDPDDDDGGSDDGGVGD